MGFPSLAWNILKFLLTIEQSMLLERLRETVSSTVAVGDTVE